MQSNIHLKEEIFRKLEIKSRETGMNPDDIVNDILEDKLDTYPDTVRLADSFKDLIDICDYSEPTDAVELKQLARERRL